MDLIQSKVRLIVQRIRERRIELKYTQNYVARKLNISQNAYSKIESGLTNFSVERLYEIAEVLQTDVKNLV